MCNLYMYRLHIYSTVCWYLHMHTVSQSKKYRMASNRMWLNIYGLSLCVSLLFFFAHSFTSFDIRCTNSFLVFFFVCLASNRYMWTHLDNFQNSFSHLKVKLFFFFCCSFAVAVSTSKANLIYFTCHYDQTDFW